MRNHRGREAVVPKTAKSARRRERLRRNILIATAAVLAVVAAAVNITFMMEGRGSAPEPIQVKPSEFRSALPVNEVFSMGPMMFSEIPAWSWEKMSKQERLRSVQAMGRLAEQKGFLGVFLVDDQKRELASWNSRTGPRILKSERPASPPSTP
jgi:hypothetical protein